MRAKAVFIGLVAIAAIICAHNAVVAFQEPSATTTTAGPKTIWDGVFTDEQAKRGQALYAEKCSNCHGSEMTGNDAPPLTGAEFGGNWTDLTLSDLADRIRITMPADNAGSLSRQQAVDIVAAILKHGEAPVGKADLPTAADQLKAIKYVATRPGK